MGFFSSIFPGSEKPSVSSGEDATRWEKAVSAVNAIAKQVAKVDSDGVDVYCFPGAEGDVDKYTEVTRVSAIKGMVTAQDPGGDCNMTAALTQAFDDAFERGFDEKPCSILVITAGQPMDKDAVMEQIAARKEQQGDDIKLEVSFVQVGSDEDATAFLQSLETDLGAEDMVDVMKVSDIKAAMDELKEPSFMESGGTGGLLGAFAGMAVGAGGYYMYNKMQAKKRTEGWNGTWEVIKPGDESTGVNLTVADDGEGNLTIEGYPEDDSAGMPCASGSYEDCEEGYSICRETADGEFIGGNVIDEHEIEWQDDTIWREVPPEGVNWAHMAAAGAAGAAAGGAVGFLVQKKFFKKANNNEPSNYMIVVDRSENMNVTD